MHSRKVVKCILIIPVLLVIWSAGRAESEPSANTEPTLPTITRGQTVTVIGHNLNATVGVALRTGKAGEVVEIPAEVAASGESVSFKVPKDNFTTGRYLVFLRLPGKELAVPGELRIIQDDAAKVEIDSISPTTAYPDGFGHYEFQISGTNLGQAAVDNSLLLVGAGWQSFAEKDCAAVGDQNVACLHYENGMGARRLTVKNFNPELFGERVKIRLKVGNNLSEPKEITFSSVTAAQVRVLAIAGSAILDVIVLALIWKGVQKLRIEDEEYGPVAAFFLDKETNSYSLSKFQLLAWTAVLVFAFIFVYLCRILIQWNFSFPPIPNGWPTLLGLSAGATVAAVGITVNRGTKGAGSAKPSMADFITTGGLVASDRFQFFVWTLIGCAAFLGLILTHDPASLTEVPDVPTGFLFLMGISASGYLGGKLVRAPGPVISQLLVTGPTPAAGGAAAMTISLKGENLSKDATVKVDGAELRRDQYSIPSDSLKVQSSAPDPSFCTELRLILKEADTYLEGSHNLTFTNKDGQMAEATFPIDPLSIDENQGTKAGPVKQTVSIKGQNFAEGMTGIWKSADGQSSSIPNPDIKKISSSELEIQLTPGVAGTGTLTLISGIGLRASKAIVVT